MQSASPLIPSDHVNGSNVDHRNGDRPGSIHYLVTDTLTGKVRYAVMQAVSWVSPRMPLPCRGIGIGDEPGPGGFVVSATRERLGKAHHSAAGIVTECPQD